MKHPIPNYPVLTMPVTDTTVNIQFETTLKVGENPINWTPVSKESWNQPKPSYFWNHCDIHRKPHACHQQVPAGSEGPLACEPKHSTPGGMEAPLDRKSLAR